MNTKIVNKDLAWSCVRERCSVSMNGAAPAADLILQVSCLLSQLLQNQFLNASKFCHVFHVLLFLQ